MSRDWTIDTWVLYEVANVNLCASSFIYTVLRKQHYIVLDHEKEIQGEYERCFNSLNNQASRALRKWFRSVLKRNFSNCLDEKCKIRLKALVFDQDDWPFIGVCVKSANKNLVAEESDYTLEIREYLNGLKINVLSVEEALDSYQQV